MREWIELLFRREVPLFFIVLLRLVVGFGFVSQGYDKVRQIEQATQARLGLSEPLERMLNFWIGEERTIYPRGSDSPQMTRKVRMFSWYRTFLEDAVVKNAKVFAVLVTAAELALGAMLILGLLVRVASVVGIFLCLNYFVATWHLGFPYTTLNSVFLVALVVFVFTSAGRSLGIDALLNERFPEIPIF